MKYSFVFFLFLNLVAGTVLSQNYQIGRASANFTDSSRNNRGIPVEIYYPADTAGSNVPVTATNNYSFPALSFGHGFVMSWDAYANIWNALVPQGYILVFPKTEGGTSPSHAAFGADLAFCLQEMRRLGTQTNSLFYNRVDSMNCVMGHSMGGGSAFIAAGTNPDIKAIATLGAAETNPSAILSANFISAPALVISGGNDCITPSPAHQSPMYDSLASDCKSYISITGGSHCQMADFNFLCNFGELTCTPAPAISRSDQHQVIFRYLLPWLDRVLKFNCSSAIAFDSLLQQDTQITYLLNCSPCNLTSVNSVKEADEFKLYPNPANESVTLLLTSISAGDYLQISDMNGRIMKEFPLENINPTIQLTEFNNGYYIVSIHQKNRVFRKSILIYKMGNHH
jgi:pimeloyl-ACP methyl ester carboxylesterase